MGKDEPIFPPGFPEEMKTEILDRHNTAKMEHDATRHGIIRAFEEMPVEHLQALDRVFSGLTEYGAAYYSGFVDGLLTTKHKVCAACGIDHDKEILGVMNDTAAATERSAEES